MQSELSLIRNTELIAVLYCTVYYVRAFIDSSNQPLTYALFRYPIHLFLSVTIYKWKCTCFYFYVC